VAYRLALTTVAATFVLILFGGLVTNTGAALAVPDWPTTFGHNMFLYPWSQMIGGVFYEHSHRLIGSVVGLLTVGLGIVLWPLGRPLRQLGLLAVAAVIAQGILGGMRVVLLQETLAIVHGCLAQAFFALLVTIAFLTWPGARRPRPVAPAGVRTLTLGVAVLVYLQIVFGALLTHAGRIDLHLAGAVAVLVLAPIMTARLRRSGDAVAARGARVLLLLLGVQLLLGVGSFLARFSPIWIPGEQLTMLALPVAHRLAASLILAATVVLAVRVATPKRTTAANQTNRIWNNAPPARSAAAPSREDQTWSNAAPARSIVPTQEDRTWSSAATPHLPQPTHVQLRSRGSDT
jgi:cytochrome c oxidase assembly protein subunit 15